VSVEAFGEKRHLFLGPDFGEASKDFKFGKFVWFGRDAHENVHVVRHQAERENLDPGEGSLPEHHVLEHLFLAFGPEGILLIHESGDNMIGGSRPPDKSWFAHRSRNEAWKLAARKEIKGCFLSYLAERRIEIGTGT